MADDDADLAELNSLEDDANYNDEPIPDQPVQSAPLPVLPPDEQHIPLPDAIAMATAPGGPPVATIGMSPLPPQEEIAPQPVQEEPAPLPMPTMPAQIIPPSLAQLSPMSVPGAGPGYIAPRSSVQNMPSSIAQQVEPYQYLLNKGQGLNAHGLNPTFAGRLTQAIQAAEAATGSKANLTDLYRSPETQAQYYANYTGRPVSFGGVTYSPKGQGGLAAAPGRSQHQQGTAADVSHGPVLDWLHKNASQFGLEFLKGNAYAKDPVHIQLAGGGGRSSQPAYADASPGPGNITSAQSSYQSSQPFADVGPGPGNITAPVQNLANARQSRFAAELQDPNVRRLLAASTQAEVGGQGPKAEQAYIESVMNRALSRGFSLSRAIQDPAYYPQSTMSKLGHGYGPDTQGRINGMITNAMQGSNVSNFATGNDSGRVHSGGAPISFNPGTGERFVQENADRKWVASLGAALGTAQPVRDVGTSQPLSRQYAMLDTGTMSDASPYMPEDDQYAEDVPEQEAPAPAASPTTSLSQTLSSPNIEMQNLQDYMKSLNQPASALPTSPVDLQPSSISTQIPDFAGMVPPYHTVAVTGADGNPQSINVMDAMVDPTIGMSKGAFMAPEALARMRQGLTPTYEETTPPNFTDEELRSMTHTGDTRPPLTNAQEATLDLIGLPGHMIGGVAGLPNKLWNAANLMANPYSQGPISSDISAEDLLAQSTTDVAQMVAGARFPFAKEPFSLGAGGGGKFSYPVDPATGRFVERPGAPVRPRDPVTGHFLPDEAIEGGTPSTDTVRFYHGGENPTSGGSRWVTPSEDYARNFRAPEGGNEVHYVDIPRDRLQSDLSAGYDKINNYYRHFEAPEDVAQQLKPLPAKAGLSPVGELLAEREAKVAAPASPEPTLPPAPQLPPPKNFREAGTNLRGLGMNPRAVAARKAAAAAETQRPIDELNALSESKPSALPELRPPTAEERIAPANETAISPPLKRVTKRPPAAAVPPAPAAAVPTPAPVAPTPAPAAIPVQVVPASAAPPVMPTSTPRVSQTPPSVPTIPQSAVPQPPIPDYPATSFSPTSYARMADDQTAPITSYYRKSGASYEALQRLKETLRLHTGGQASAIARAAAENGHALTPAVNFHVDTPLSEIARYAKHNPNFNDYLHAGDTLDELQAMQRNMSRNNPQQQGLFSGLPSTTKAGPMTLHGYTEADLHKYIRDAEHLNPDFARVGDLYRANIREARRAMADGEFATMTSKNHQDANALNPNEVPQHRRDRSRERVDAEGQPIKRPDPIAAAADFIHRAIRKRLTNEAVGQTIHALHNNPGSRGMYRPITSAELRQSPHLLSRVVTFRRYGKYEHWLANSQTMSDLLKMDPYHFASHSGTHMMDAARRLQVANTTGLMAPWFAKTDADRNWLIGQMTVGAASKGMGPGRIIPQMVMGRKLGFIPVPAFPRRPPSRYGIRQTLGLTGFPLGPGTMPWAAASQLVPKLAKHAAFSINSTSGGWLRRAFGDKAADHLATVLAGAYHRSTLAQLEARGTHSGGLVRAGENRHLQNNYIDQAIARSKSVAPGLDTSLAGARNVINAVHSMPQFAYIQRNLKHVARQVRKEMGPNATHEQVMEETFNKLHLEANDMAGDPLITGRFYTPSGSKIRYDPGAQVTGFKRFAALTAGKIAEHGWVAPNEFGRHMVTWHNMTVQGLKRFPASFVKNPTEFLARSFTYGAVPSALLYWYNASQGKDPQGIPYVDHMMNGRTEYRKAMYHYIGIKGLPAWMGLEYPSFQELIPMKMMVEAGMDHYHGKSIWTMGQDAQAALTSTLDNAVLPPLHPLMQAAFEAAGVAAPANYGGLWPISKMFGGVLGQNTGNVDLGGEVYVRRGDKYIEENRPVSQIMSSTFRAIAAASADMLLAGYAAASHTPGSLTDALENAAKATGKLVLRRTPEVGNLLGYDNPLSNNTRITSEMMARRAAVDRINNYFNAYGVTGIGHIGHAKPLSKSGEMMATAKLGQNLPPEPMGLNEPPPTNPLYLKFIQFLHARTESDSLEKGGMGYKSLWRRYNDAGADARSMLNIDTGNQVTWEKQIQARPSVMRLLQNTGVDWKNPTAVRSYLVHEQQRAARAINDAITSVERDMSNIYKRPIKIEDLDPYGAPNMTDAANARYLERTQQGQGQ